METLNKIIARVYLFAHFCSHLFQRVFRLGPKRGLEDFWKHYHADSIFPVSRRERMEFPSYQKCIGCSLCTFDCVAIKEGNAPSGFEPKYLLLSAGRSSTEAELMLENWVPCVECKRCEVTCPNDVPVHQMAERILERRNYLGFRQ